METYVACTPDICTRITQTYLCAHTVYAHVHSLFGVGRLCCWSMLANAGQFECCPVAVFLCLRASMYRPTRAHVCIASRMGMHYFAIHKILKRTALALGESNLMFIGNFRQTHILQAISRNRKLTYFNINVFSGMVCVTRSKSGETEWNIDRLFSFIVQTICYYFAKQLFHICKRKRSAFSGSIHKLCIKHEHR